MRMPIVVLLALCSATLCAGAADHPLVELTTPQLNVVVYVPDAAKGFYRAQRFDWSGHTARIVHRGHTFTGPWKTPHDPLNQEAGMGPAEEFGLEDPAGYAEAAVGGSFAKIGVGVLGRADDGVYRFNKKHPVRALGVWTTTTGERWVESCQVQSPTDGWAWRYVKRIELDAAAPVMSIRHVLTNTGSKRIATSWYCHNFINIDGEKVGPSYRLATPEPVRPAAGEAAGSIAVLTETGPTGLRLREAMAGKALWGHLVGASNQPPAFAATIHNDRAGAAVAIAGDHPLLRSAVYALPAALCWEPFIAIALAPGEELTWTVRYTFSAERDR